MDARRVHQDMGTIATQLDWLGINFYTRELASRSDDPRFPGIDVSRGDLTKTGIGWEIYPQGLATLFDRLRADYATPALYVTENGMASDVHKSDEDRVAYFNDHLRVCADAIRNGTDLRVTSLGPCWIILNGPKATANDLVWCMLISTPKIRTASTRSRHY